VTFNPEQKRKEARERPIQTCLSCSRCRRTGPDTYECHPRGSWFIKEIKGGYWSVAMPNQRPCWEPKEGALDEARNDPFGLLAEAREAHKGFLEELLKANKMEGHTTDSKASRFLQ